jgi:hypothetical protein
MRLGRLIDRCASLANRSDNLLALRRSDSKWQARGQLPAREWRSKFTRKNRKVLILLDPGTEPKSRRKALHLKGFLISHWFGTPSNTASERWLQPDVAG